jgi:hypothetical protein
MPKQKNTAAIAQLIIDALAIINPDKPATIETSLIENHKGSSSFVVSVNGTRFRVTVRG